MHPRHRRLKNLLITPAFGLILATGSMAPAAEADRGEVWNEYLEHLRQTKGVVDIRMIHDSGSGPGAFNLMVVSAGFRAEESDDFHAVCETMARSLFQEDPWRKYKDMVNIHAIHVDDESPDKTRVHVSGYQGQVLNCENKPAIEFANFAGRSDNTVVIHNSDFSTPTCGPWAMVTCHRGTAGNYRVLHHELGHSVGGLGDKYTQRPGRYDGSIKNLWEGKNATDQPNPLLTQWHYWTQDMWPGLFGPQKLPKSANVINYEGAAWATGFYRPEEKCVMHGGDSPAYCTICTEVMESCFFRTIHLFEDVSPPPGDVVLWKGETQTFSVKALKFIREPRPWLESRLEFHVNGNQAASSRNGEVTYRFGGPAATPGYHQIGANLNVQAEYVRRDDGFLGASRAWRVKVMAHEKPRLILPPGVTVAAGKTVRVPIQVEHPRKDLVDIRMSHAPDGASLQGGAFEWRAAKPGAWRVDFTVSIDKQEAVTESLEIRVKPDDAGDGTIRIGKLAPVDALVGKETAIQLEASSAKEGQILYHLVNPLSGMDLDRATGRLVWTPRVDQYGPHRLVFRVGNGSAYAEGSVLIGVCNEPAPYLNSYLTTYNRDRNQWLEDHRESPFIYDRIFEISRMFRERFSDIYTPALDEAKVMYPTLGPGMREAFLQELARHAWTFVDRPAILEWLTEISRNGGSESARHLQSQLIAIRLWAKVKETELGGNPRHLAPLLDQFSKTTNVGAHSAIRRAVKTLYGKADDKDAFRNEVRAVMQKSKGRELAAMLPVLPDIAMPGKEEILLKVALDPDGQVSRSALQTLDKLTASGTQVEIESLSKLLITSADPKKRAVIAEMLVAISNHINDRPKSQESMLGVLENTTGPGRAELLRLLPLVSDPKLAELLERFGSGSDLNLSSAARKAQKYLTEEIGATDAFVASWQLSGPYPVEDNQTVFAPETGEAAEWQSYQCPQTSGTRFVPLGSVFGGDNRVAYMKAAVRSENAQQVLIGAGSDDGIEVWLNGGLIHANHAMRAMKADEDRFTGKLKAGENVILCKIRQFSQGWEACMTIRAANGGPALGVSVVSDRP
jgi:hypothetical protein